jgi:hypothetical protein
MRNFKPMLVGGVMAASFSALAFAQSTKDNTHYNIHQKGEQNSSQTGDSSQSAQTYGSGNTTSNTQQYGSGDNSALDSGPGSASAGASTDRDHGKGDRYGKSDDERHDNGKHEGWSKNGKDRD